MIAVMGLVAVIGGIAFVLAFGWSSIEDDE